ncbi:MAG: hypothetical protein ABIR35_11675 [Polaromonas sp.]
MRPPPMKPPRRRNHSGRAADAFALPSHWTPAQALAVFECLELLRDQLWLTYAAEIQHAWRNQLVLDRVPPGLDPDAPF